MITIGILVSHEGITCQAVLDACKSETLPARVQQHERKFVVEMLTGIAKGTIQLPDFRP